MTKKTEAEAWKNRMGSMTQRKYLRELLFQYRSHFRLLDERGRLLQNTWLAELCWMLREAIEKSQQGKGKRR